MVRLRVRKSIAHALTLLFFISPEVILYENNLYLSYPAAFLICLACYFLNRALESQHNKHWFGLFAICGALVLLLSFFNLAWYMLILLALILGLKKVSKKILIASLLPLFMILALCSKNYFLFGKFASSLGFFNFQVAKMVIFSMPSDKVQELIDNKNISALTANEIQHPFYIGQAAYNRKDIPEAGIPLIDEFYKSTGYPNIESKYHLASFYMYGKDVNYLFRKNLKYYFRTIHDNMLVYSFPGPTDAHPFPNRDKIAGYEDRFHFMFRYLNKINSGKLYTEKLWGAPDFKTIKYDRLSVFFLIVTVAFYVSLIIFIPILLISMYKKGEKDIGFIPSTLFMWLSIVYVSLVGIFFSDFGQNRYRFYIQVFYFVFIGIAASNLLEKFSKRNAPK
ncbi:MAG: hypothetical protein HQL27_01275 [Candidatus Omnitrophica bacterium]|nr:hypothetical protein [Candidatus Omnitrophota bacterium]